MKTLTITALLTTSLMLTGCTKSDSQTASDSAPAQDSIVDSMTDQAQEVIQDQIDAVEESALHTGSFSGRNDHIVTGTVTIVKAGDKQFLVLGPAFTLDGAPDPKIGFGSNDTYDAESMFTPLNKLTGTQRYEIPANIDPSSYNQVYIWCDKFSVALGVASIE
ncbi:MAG: DM13 domain-containing protein [Phycisphaerales bacterium]